MIQVYTRGNVIVNEINVGDIHYEYDFGHYIKVRVRTKPVRNDGGQWIWISEKLDVNGNVVEQIDYLVTEGMSHYSPKLYDYEAYQGCKQL